MERHSMPRRFGVGVAKGARFGHAKVVLPNIENQCLDTVCLLRWSDSNHIHIDHAQLKFQILYKADFQHLHPMAFVCLVLSSFCWIRRRSTMSLQVNTRIMFISRVLENLYLRSNYTDCQRWCSHTVKVHLAAQNMEGLHFMHTQAFCCSQQVRLAATPGGTMPPAQPFPTQREDPRTNAMQVQTTNSCRTSMFWLLPQRDFFRNFWN